MTVNVVLPDMPVIGSVAVMVVVVVVVVPAVARPVGSIVATLVFDELQITEVVRSRVGVIGSKL